VIDGCRDDDRALRACRMGGFIAGFSGARGGRGRRVAPSDAPALLGKEEACSRFREKKSVLRPECSVLSPRGEFRGSTQDAGREGGHRPARRWGRGGGAVSRGRYEGRMKCMRRGAGKMGNFALGDAIEPRSSV